MAKTIEIAFCQVWDRKSVKSLKSAELGAYMALTHACLVQGFDPLPNDRDTLQLLSRSSRIQWERGRQRIMNAFQDTIGTLRARYEKAEARFERFSKRGTNNFSGYWDQLRLKRAAKSNALNSAEQFSDDASRTSLLQPLKSSQTYSQNYAPKSRVTSHTVSLID